ncbi:coiled-coil domain-containing protein 34 isoform X1 [Osmerus mordax]|uniref:coiled-coil domain-containing protein 34 isoform X1 n=1 Tax=Osmerus mordax TaxID=8014 RepID=UPI00350FAE0B
MTTFPTSASKSFSSTPLKKQSTGTDLHRSKSVDADSPHGSTYSLLSPIYHDSFDSDEEGLSPATGRLIDTSATQSEDARPVSPARVELPRKPPQSTRTEGDDPTASLNAWERWLVCKAKDERIRMERKLEEERIEKEKQEKQEIEQHRKKMVVEEKIQEWLKMKREQEKQEKQQKQSRRQEEMQKQQQKQRDVEQKAQQKYREWLRRKNQEKMEKEIREKEEVEKKDAQERERRQRAEEKFKEWLASAHDKSQPCPKTAGCCRGVYDTTSYPSPSFYNPIPWKPIHVPPPEKPPKKKTSHRKVQSQPKYQHSPRMAFRLRDTVSSAHLQTRR